LLFSEIYTVELWKERGADLENNITDTYSRPKSVKLILRELSEAGYK